MSTRGIVVSVAIGVVGGAAVFTLMRTPETSVDANSTGAADSETEARTQPTVPTVEDSQTAEPAEDSVAAEPQSDSVEAAAIEQQFVLSTEQQERLSSLIADLERGRPVPLPDPTVQMIRQFVMEDVDEEWSAPTESQIFGGISAVSGLAAVNIEVECRSTLCRIEILHPQDAADDDVLTGATIIEVIQRSGLEPRWLSAYPDDYGNPVSRAYVKKGDVDTTQTVLEAVTASL